MFSISSCSFLGISGVLCTSDSRANWYTSCAAVRSCTARSGSSGASCCSSAMSLLRCTRGWDRMGMLRAHRLTVGRGTTSDTLPCPARRCCQRTSARSAKKGRPARGRASALARAPTRTGRRPTRWACCSANRCGQNHPAQRETQPGRPDDVHGEDGSPSEMVRASHNCALSFAECACRRRCCPSGRPSWGLCSTPTSCSRCVATGAHTTSGGRAAAQVGERRGPRRRRSLPQLARSAVAGGGGGVRRVRPSAGRLGARAVAV